MDRFVYAAEHLNWGAGYIILIILYTFLSFMYKEYNQKYFFYFALFLVIFISGTRSIVNYDMENYKIMYENYKSLTVLEIEPGFIFLSWLLNFIAKGPYLLFFTYSFLNVAFVYLGIKNFTERLAFPFFLYLTFPSLFLMSLIGIRQNLAEAIFFYAVSHLFRKDLFKFIVFGILAVFFHYSAIFIFIIVLGVYFLIKGVNFTFSVMLVAASIFIDFLGINKLMLVKFLSFIYPVLPAKYDSYAMLLIAGRAFNLKGFSIYSLILFNALLLLILYFISFFRKTDDKFARYDLIINLLIAGTFYVNIFGSFADVTARLFNYFLFFYIILIPVVLSKFTKYLRITAIYLLAVFSIVWFFSGVYKKIGGIHTPPLIYKNIIINFLRDSRFSDFHD